MNLEHLIVDGLILKRPYAKPRPFQMAHVDIGEDKQKVQEYTQLHLYTNIPAFDSNLNNTFAVHP